MSRKHYIELATIIRTIDKRDRARVAVLVADMCYNNNPNFKRDRFYRACEVECLRDIRARLLLILTNYDKRQSNKRGYNPYALGHYCRGIGEVCEALDNGEAIESALKKSFCGSLLRHIAKKLGVNHTYDRWE